MPSTSFKDETMIRVVSFLTLFLSFNVIASMHIADHCQERFEGIAVSVYDIDDVDHLMAKVKVKLEIIFSEHTDDQYLEFKYLKHSMVAIEQDKSYSIGMNNGKLCLVEEIK